MSVYAIGDVQGCYDALQRLLDLIQFDPNRDTLWFAGDLVNRGEDSLAVLRFVKGLGKGAVTVLGNHDLHLLAMAQGNVRYRERSPTLESTLAAPDLPEIVEWLRHRPLMHYSKRRKVSMIHAGVPPQWSRTTALKRAAEVEQALRGELFPEFMHNLYGNRPDLWSKQLSGWDRLRFIANCLTRLRYCDSQGRFALNEKGPLGSQHPSLKPWFAIPGSAWSGERILFGHWSTLGYRTINGATCIDTGCVWGGRLSALKIRKNGTTRLYQVASSTPG